MAMYVQSVNHKVCCKPNKSTASLHGSSDISKQNVYSQNDMFTEKQISKEKTDA